MKHKYLKFRTLYFRIKGASGELSIIILGKCLSIIFNILGLKWITHLLEPAVFGKFTLVLSYVFVVELLFGVLAQGISRYYFISKEKKEYNTLKKVFLHYLKYIVVLGFAISFGISLYVGSALLGLLIFIFIIVSGVSNIISLVQNSERKRIIVSVHEMFDKLAKFGLSGLFILFIAPSVEVLMLGYVVAILLIACSQFYFYNKKIRILFQDEDTIIDSEKLLRYKKDIQIYSMPFLIWTIFFWVQNNSDKWLIDSFFSEKEVGLYQVINQYGFQLINMATGMLTIFLIPILFQKAGNSYEKTSIINSININNKVSALFFGLFLIFVPFTFLIHKKLFNFLVSSDFTTYSYLFPYMVFAGGCFAVAQLLSNNYLISFKTRSLIVPKIFISIFGIVVNFVSIKYFGLTGLVIGILITNLTYLIWMYLGSLKLKRNLHTLTLNIK